MLKKLLNKLWDGKTLTEGQTQKIYPEGENFSPIDIIREYQGLREKKIKYPKLEYYYNLGRIAYLLYFYAVVLEAKIDGRAKYSFIQELYEEVNNLMLMAFELQDENQLGVDEEIFGRNCNLLMLSHFKIHKTALDLDSNVFSSMKKVDLISQLYEFCANIFDELNNPIIYNWNWLWRDGSLDQFDKSDHALHSLELMSEIAKQCG